MRRKTVIGLFVIGLCALALAACPKGVPEKTKEPEVGKEYHPEGTKGGPMVFVPEGEFMMGCNGSVDKECAEWEKPYHEVYIDAFDIDKYEVTVEQYEVCVKAGKCKAANTSGSCNTEKPDRKNHPVNCVSWHDAKAYCKYAGKKLPTEAQWEKGARGTDGKKYPWSNQDAGCDYAVMSDGERGCGENSTWPVGSKPGGASPYGAMDMAGNVWEWTADWYSPYGKSPDSNPEGPSSGKYRILRGGSWFSLSSELRTSLRSRNVPAHWNNVIGFRCAKDAE